MFSIAILSVIVHRTLQTWKELNLLNLALRFATTLAEKVSLQGLGGMVSEIIVGFKGGVAITVAAVWMYVLYLLNVGLSFR